MKIKGFTLAEVLITLGIIGIVAALTMPNLIAAHQKKAVVAGLIEAQSILNQAIKMYAQDTDEEGSNDFETTLSAQAFAEKYFKPYLKVAQVCTKMSDGCWKTGDFYGYYDLSGAKQTETVPYSLVLNNGMVVGFSKIDGYQLISILVDVNGRGRRNVLGKDVFVFYPYNSANLCGSASPKWKNIKNGIYPGGFDNCGSPHIAYSRKDLLAPNTVYRSCNKKGTNKGDGQGKRTGPGTACAAVIFKDGWKISSDYPWN